MASTVAGQTRDFARRFFEVIEELGREDWVSANVAFERTVSAHPDDPYVAYVNVNRARKAGFAAAAERVRQREFPQIERRKAGPRRNAPVFYRVGGGKVELQLDLPYEVPSSHPLRVARTAPTGNPLRRERASREARAPWRRRLSRRRTSEDASSEPQSSAGWWHRLAEGATALLHAVKRAASKRQR